MKKISVLLFLLMLLACSDDGNEPDNLSDEFSICNSKLAACSNGDGDYCLFGLKWGESNGFTDIGYDAEGPQVSGGAVTYSFMENNGTFNTHRQIDVVSESFDNLVDCAKVQFRNALNAWSGIAQIDFEELPENSDSDIRFYTGDIVQSGIGYPNYTLDMCTDLGGNVTIQSNIAISDCNLFYALALHETGHVLGLGHVENASVMSPNFRDLNIFRLQSNDSLGIIQIYGAR